NTVFNASGYGEGERFFASITVATNARGTANFSLTVTIAIPSDQFITATATDPVGNTSQFSNCLPVSVANPPDPPPGGGGGTASQGIGGMETQPVAVPVPISLPSHAERDLFFGMVWREWQRVGLRKEEGRTGGSSALQA